MATLLLLSGCETQPVKPQPSIHKERGRDVYKGWAVTGCVATMESGQHATGDRGLMIDLCRSMTDLYQKNQCRITIPVNRSSERSL